MNDPPSIDRRPGPSRRSGRPRGSRLSLPQLAHRGGVPDAPEQPRSGRRRESGCAGRLRRHRQGRARLASFDAILAALKDLRDDESLLVQSGKPVGVFRTHADAPRVLIANSNLVPKWATWEHFDELDAQGPDDVRPDDRRLVDLHRQPGHRAGNLRDVRRGRSPALRRLARRTLDPHGGARRHGRRAAAGRELRRRIVAQHRVPAGSDRVPAAHALPRRAGARPRRRARADREVHGGRRREVDRPARQRRGHRARDCDARSTGRTASRPRHRPDVRARSRQRLSAVGLAGRAMARRAGGPVAARGAARGGREELRNARAGDAATCRRWAFRPSTTATTSGRWRSTRALRTRSTSRASCPAYIRPLFCRGKGPFRWVALSGDPEDIFADRSQAEGAVPRRSRTCIAGSTSPASASRSRACRRASAGWDWASAIARASRSTRWCAAASFMAPIVIGRDHLDSGSVASPEPRDRERCATAPMRCPTGRCSTRC